MKHIFIPSTGSYTMTVTDEDAENYYAESKYWSCTIPKIIIEPYSSASFPYPHDLQYLTHIPDGFVSNKVHLIKWYPKTLKAHLLKWNPKAWEGR